jgi:hypothetical protein
MRGGHNTTAGGIGGAGGGVMQSAIRTNYNEADGDAGITNTGSGGGGGAGQPWSAPGGYGGAGGPGIVIIRY